MTTEHNIAKQEAELKELLNRVMDAPLQPLKKSVEDISKHFDILEKIEDQIKELRENDLIPLQKLERLEKLGKEIKSLIEDDFSANIKKELNALQTSQQSALEKIEENLVKHIDTVQAQVNGNTVHLTNELQNSLNFQHGELIQLQNQNLGELNALQTSQQSALEKTEENLVKHIDTVQAQVNGNTVNLINALITSNEKMQIMLKTQYEQISQLQQKNAALTIQYDKKLSHSFLSTKKWIVIATSLAGIGAIETGVVLAQHWF